MKISARLIAIAPCTTVMPFPLPDDNLVSIQVTPAGFFRPSDGRDLAVPGWRIDAALASRVIDRFTARQNPIVLDYEHQTLHKETNGQPAPAAGWFKSLEWREGSGLWATIELTARAKQYMTDGEYRYFSPVFAYDRVTGDVLDLHMGALTNNPAIDGMQSIALRAAATFGINQEDDSMDLLKALLAALGLPETTNQDQAIAALTARLETNSKLRIALSLDENADADSIVTACTALKAKAEKVDPAKFVPVETVQALQTEMAALSARISTRDEKDVTALIDAALEDGRLMKPLEAWARDLGKSDVAALTAYLGAAQPLAALSGSQTFGKPPVIDDKTGLSADELAVCTAMGVDPKDFKSAKEA